MSDYTDTFGGAAKDQTGVTVILGADHDTEYANIETAIATKANKVIGGTTDNLTKQDANGDTVDAGIALGALTTAELAILTGATVTTAELNILDGATLDVNELNILDGVTSTAAELNILDGVTSTTAELNILDGVTSTASELNILDGATLDVTELNYVDGVTSSIQTQLDTFVKTKIVAIGTWNMASTASVSVAHGLTLANIRGMTVTIVEDGGANRWDFGSDPGSTWEANATNVVLTRTAVAPFFDNAFDGATDRGYIVITYV